MDEGLRRVGSGIWIVSFGSLFSLFWKRMGQRDIELSETLTNLWYDIGIAQTTIQADDEEEE